MENKTANSTIKSLIYCLFLLVYFVSPNPAHALAIDPPVIQVLSNIQESKIYFNNFSTSIKQNAEISPISIGSKTFNPNGHHIFIVSSSSSYFCNTPDNIFQLTQFTKIAPTNPCPTISKQALNVNNYSIFMQLPRWKRDYNGVFSAQLIKFPSGNTQLVTINHGEIGNNSGNMSGGPYNPCATADIGYGVLPCDSNYWWGSYNAFVTMSSMDWTSQNLATLPLKEHGPIIWPSNGYVESLDNNQTWIKATEGGVRHPMSLVDNGYLYVFYADESQGEESDGRGIGIKVARAPIINNGIDPNSFHSYYNGNWDEKSLPTGFSLNTYQSMFKQKGGRASSLFTESIKTLSPTPGTKRVSRKVSEATSFHVAKIVNSNYYLGTSLEADKGTTLRLSKDLVNWSEPFIIPGSEFNRWNGDNIQETPLLYPRLVNKNGDSNNTIDASEFYVIGTQTNINYEGLRRKIVNTVKLSIQLPLESTAGDFNQDSLVNIFDYNILIAGFGTKYDIFDYNELIANYGK